MSDRSRSSSPASQRSRSNSRASSRSVSKSRSRSRSFSSSSSSSPRFVSATDSDSDKRKSGSGSGNDSPQRRKVRTKKSSPKQAESDSEAEEEPETKRKPKKGSAAAKKGKKKKDESEEGEISGSNDSAREEEFDDGLDEDLIGDDKDRARLEKMTEREREEELFKRAEKREDEKKKFEIQKRLKKENKLKAKDKPERPEKSASEKSGSDSGEARSRDASREPDSDKEAEDKYADHGVENTKVRSQTRKEKMEEKKFDQKSSALSELKAKRQEKERKDAERHKKQAAKEEKKKKERSSSSSSSAGSGSERSRRSSSSSARSSSEGDSDTERFKKSPSKVQKYIETQEDLEPIRLSRFKMEKFVHLPIFKKLVMNCFVRIGIGQYQGRSVYRAAEIVDVVETGKVYFVGKMRTNIGTKLKFGREERVFRLEFISNQRISPQEFVKWKEACNEANISLPTIESVKSKASEIKKAMNFSFTSEDVDKMVAQKEKFQRNPVNYAMHKARLIKDKEIAIAQGEDAKAKQMETKLNELEERAEELDKKRTSTISSVSLINDRNRKANVNKAEQAIMVEIKRKAIEGVESNPFKRKACLPRLVTKKVAGSPEKPQKQAEQKENLTKVSDTAIPVKRKTDDDDKDDDSKNDAKAKKKAKLGTSGLPLSMQKEDLFDAHNFDIEIDVNTDLMGSPNPDSAGAMVAPINLKPTSSERAPAKRSFNLDDYKKKRGLI